MSGTPEERELDQLMADARALEQRYRAAAQEEPPAHLDQAIRAAARREAGARPRLAGSPFSQSWRIPLSIAAVVVLSVTLTLMVVERHADVPSADKAAPPAEVPSPQTEPAVGKDSDVKPTAKPREPKTQPRAAAPAPQAQIQSDQKKSDTTVLSNPTPRAKPDRGAREDSPAQTSPPVGETRSLGAAPATAPASPPDEGRSETFQDSPSPAERSEQTQPANADNDSGVRDTLGPPSEDQSRAGASSLKARPADRPAPPLARRKQASEAQAAPWEKDPEAWLKHIEALRKAGRMDEARASFEGFQRRFPGYSLPPGFVVPQR